MAISERIKRLRRDLGGIPQAELGARLGVTANTVASWEQGLREPEGINCAKLAALSSGEMAEFFARRVALAGPGARNSAAVRVGEMRAAGSLDPLGIELVVRRIVDARLSGLEERIAEGFARIEKQISQVLDQSAPGVRIRKAVQIRGRRE